MTSQYDFSNADWERVAAAPMIVGIAVAKAEDSGFFGSLKETRTLIATLDAEVAGGPAKAMIEAAVATETSDATEALKDLAPDLVADAAIDVCRRISAALSQTASPEESLAYRQWVLGVARTVADAAKEHGVRTSPAEAALIERIAAGLDLA